MYNNLAMYHLHSDKDGRCSKYMDGAIISNKREQESYSQVVSLAISMNNKAVIELKKGNFEQSRVFSIRTVEMVEQRVFGMINSGLVTKAN